MADNIASVRDPQTAYHFLTGAALAAIAVGLCVNILIKRRGGHAKMIRIWRRVARKPGFACAILGLATFLSAAVVGVIRPIYPRIEDEFGYLLQADTFARGRLTNETPVFWRHVEAPHILVLPSYQAKYPPAQGLILASGLALFGTAAAGVWLSAGLAIAALTWALQAWVGRLWAVFAATLAALQIGVFGYWSQSYWGGFLAMTGGCLLFGAVRRLRRTPRASHGIALGAGLALLANCRPYEGLAAALGAALYLAWPAWSGRELKARLKACAVAFWVLIPAAGWMGYYNFRVTGSSFRLPYLAYESRYSSAPLLNFQTPSNSPVYASPQAGRDFFEIDRQSLLKREAQKGLDGFLFINAFRLRRLWTFFFGLPLTLPLLMCAATGGRRWAPVLFFALGVLGSVSMSSGAFSEGLLLVSAAGLLALLAGVLPRGLGAIIPLVGLSFACLALESFAGFPHYVAPFAAIYFILLAASLKRVKSLAVPTLVAAVLFLASRLSVTPLHARVSHFHCTFENIPAGDSGRLRMLVEESLPPGRHLMFIHSAPWPGPGALWFYNGADFASQRVLWMRELGSEPDAAVARLFPDARVWHLDAAALPMVGGLECGGSREAGIFSVNGK